MTTPTVTTATRTIPAPVAVLGFGLALGITGDLVLRAMPWGLNFAAWLLLLLGAAAWIARQSSVEMAPETPWLAITAFLLALGFAMRDAEEMQASTVLGLLGVLGATAAAARGLQLRRTDLVTWLRHAFGVGVSTAIGILPLATVEMPWDKLRERGPLRHAAGVGVGILIAAPLLLVFGALFSSADAVFANVIANLVRPEVLVPHVVWALVWTVLATGWLRYGLLGRAAPAAPVLGTAAFVPVATALGLVTALFLLFVAVQLRYLFGGSGMVETTIGLTYAEYARRGYFELVAASGLSLPVLIGAEWAVRAEPIERQRIVRRLATVLLGLLGIIVASALERMRLYVAAYGMTVDRLLAAACEVFLLGLFVWFGVTALRGRPERLPFGAFVWALLSLAGLHAINPHAFVARWNTTRPSAEGKFDAEYLSHLSADAAPVLYRALPALAPADRCVIAKRLRQFGDDAHKGDWRSWNAARSSARRLALSHSAELDAACPAPASDASQE